MDLSGLAEVVYSLLAVAVFATLIVSNIAAVVGARLGAAVHRRTLAVFAGFFVGVVMAIIAGSVVLYYADSFGGLLLAPVVAAATAFIAAWRIAS